MGGTRQRPVADRWPRHGSGAERGVTLPEVATVAALLTALAAVTLGARVLDGGFSNDDWGYLTQAQHPERPGLGGLLDEFGYFDFRPLTMVYLMAAFGGLGAHAGAHLAVLVAVGVIECLLLHAVLRTFGADRLVAGLAAALALTLPLADSTRLWACLAPNVLAVAVWLGGVLLSAAAFRHRGRRALVLHALALVAYVASIAAYELTAGVVLLTGLLFVLREGRRAVRPWLVQVVAAGAMFAFASANTFYEPLHGAALRHHARTVATDAVKTAAQVVWAPGQPSAAGGALAWLAVAATLGAAVVLLRRGRLTGATAGVVRPWLRIAAAAAVVGAAALVMAVPSSFFSPALPGESNRGNILAGPAAVVLVAAAVAVAVAVLTQRARSPVVRPVLTTVALLAIGAGYVVRLHDDVSAWNAATAEQRAATDLVATTVPRPPGRAALFLVGRRDSTAPGVPVFAAVWDLRGALVQRWDAPRLRAYPVTAGSRLTCERGGLRLNNDNDAFEPQRGTYGATVLVDARTSRSSRVPDRAACLRAVAAVRPLP